MSKSSADPWRLSDPVPSYEESVASSKPSPDLSLGDMSMPRPYVMRQERSRRIASLVINSVIPCFTLHLSNACNKLAIACVPSDILRNSRPLTEQNIVAPSVSNDTTLTIIPLTLDESRSSFWTQHAVVQELDQLLRRELCDSEVQDGILDETTDPKSPPLPSVPGQSEDTAELPPRPAKKSWLRKTFVLPGPEHDPTGETGKWNLGWRETGSYNGGGGSGNNSTLQAGLSTTRSRSRTLKADEVDVHTRLQDVSFRTETELGLLETTTVKCVWIEIEVGI